MLRKLNSTSIVDQFGLTEKKADNGYGVLISTKEESPQEDSSAQSCKGDKGFSSYAPVQQPADDGDVRQCEAEELEEIKHQEAQLLPAPPTGNLVKLVFDAKGVRLALTND